MLQQLPTIYVGDGITPFVHVPAMLGKQEILDALTRKIDAGEIRKADVGRALDLPSPRIAELFGGRRDLSADEAAILVKRFGLLGAKIDLPSEADFEEMLREVQQEIPASLPFAEWPRVAASALYTRLELRAGMMPSSLEDDPVEDVPAEGAPAPSPTTRAARG